MILRVTTSGCQSLTTASACAGSPLSSPPTCTNSSSTGTGHPASSSPATGPWTSGSASLTIPSSATAPSTGWPTTHSGSGVGSGPTWSTCGSFTLRRPPWKPQWKARCRCCWKPATPSSSHRPTAWCRACPCVGRGAAGRQARSGPAPPAAQAGQLRLPAPRRPGLPAPGRRRVRGPLHPDRRTLRTPVVGHYVKPGLLGVGTHLRQPHGHRRGD